MMLDKEFLAAILGVTMKKRDAAKLFGGTQSALARALDVSRQRINQLPEDLPMYYRDRVVGAAQRLGVAVPVEMLMERSSESVSS